MRIRSFEALLAGCTAAFGATAQLLDPIKNYCTRFDHQCKVLREILTVGCPS